MGLCARLSRSANPCVLLAVICIVVIFNLSHHMSKYLMQSMSVFKVHGAGKIGVRAPYLLRRPDRGADLPLTKSSHRRDLIAHATSNTSHKPYFSQDSRYSRFSGLTGPLQATRSVAYFTREVNSNLAKSPLNLNGGLAKLQFTPVTKSATVERIPSLHGLEQFPSSSRSKSLFPDPYRPHDDRILAQMGYQPDLPPSTKPKVILSYSAISGIKTGVSTFHRAKCKVKKCIIQYDLERWASRADAVLFTYYPGPHLWSRRWEQVWILSALESPFHTVYLDGFRDQINWTATYRTDSVLVTPYEKFLLSENRSHQHKPRVNYAANKTKLVAWFVSNCMAKNQRMRYGRALSRYIQVDIYGACGSRSCPRERKEECFDMLKKDYKFYLAFENSNCRDYITEKLFVNALAHGIIPIVMGARKEDYKAIAPPGSFIHVEDFQSPKELSKHLHKLNLNDTLYNEYFKWRETGTFVDTKFWCRLCALLHAPDAAPVWYDDVGKWWRYGDACTGHRWDNPRDHVRDWSAAMKFGV